MPRRVLVPVLVHVHVVGGPPRRSASFETAPLLPFVFGASLEVTVQRTTVNVADKSTFSEYS